MSGLYSILGPHFWKRPYVCLTNTGKAVRYWVVCVRVKWLRAGYDPENVEVDPVVLDVHPTQTLRVKRAASSILAE